MSSAWVTATEAEGSSHAPTGQLHLLRATQCSLPHELTTAPDEFVLAQARLRLIFEKIQRATTPEAAEAARRLIPSLDSGSVTAVALVGLESPQAPDRLDYLEEVLAIHASPDEVALLVTSRPFQRSPAFRIGLAGVIAAQVQFGNAANPATSRLIELVLEEIAADDLPSVRIAAVDALDRVASHLPAALDVLIRLAEADANESVRQRACEARDDLLRPPR